MQRIEALANEGFSNKQIGELMRRCGVGVTNDNICRITAKTKKQAGREPNGW